MQWDIACPLVALDDSRIDQPADGLLHTAHGACPPISGDATTESPSRSCCSSIEVRTLPLKQQLGSPLRTPSAARQVQTSHRVQLKRLSIPASSALIYSSLSAFIPHRIHSDMAMSCHLHVRQ